MTKEQEQFYQLQKEAVSYLQMKYDEVHCMTQVIKEDFTEGYERYRCITYGENMPEDWAVEYRSGNYARFKLQTIGC